MSVIRKPCPLLLQWVLLCALGFPPLSACAESEQVEVAVRPLRSEQSIRLSSEVTPGAVVVIETEEQLSQLTSGLNENVQWREEINWNDEFVIAVRLNSRSICSEFQPKMIESAYIQANDLHLVKSCSAFAGEQCNVLLEPFSLIILSRENQRDKIVIDKDCN